MFKLRQTVSSLVIVVAFLALATLATVSYSPNEEDRLKFRSSALYQKSWLAIQAIFFTSEKLADTELAEKTGFGQKVRDFILGKLDETDQGGSEYAAESQSEEASSAAPDFATVSDQARQAIDSLGATEELNWLEESNWSDKVSLRNFIYLGNTEVGSEIILWPQSDNEYRLRLPFHLSDKQ